MTKESLQYAVGGLLYMPATNIKIANTIIEYKISNLRSICLCLEDAIGDDAVSAAEKCVFQILNKLHSAQLKDKPLIFVRVRNPDQMIRLAKNCGRELLSELTGFNFPKFDTSNYNQYIDVFTDIRDKYNDNLFFMPILESKTIMYRQSRIDSLLAIHEKLAPISDRVLNIRVGATDFCNIFGVRRDVFHTIYDINVVKDCLSDIVNVFTKNYVVSGPVWEYFDTNGNPGYWSHGLTKELQLDRMNGFIGKTCIHPSQLPFVEKSLQVTREDYQDAVSILGMSDGLIGVQKSAANNKMNEVKTHTKWAKKIINLYNIYGFSEVMENVI